MLRLRDLSDEEAEMHLKKWNEIFTAAFAFILNVGFGTVRYAEGACSNVPQ